MTEERQSAPSVPPAATAGALLRAAREQQGVHIAVLAAAIKISPRKLDALEGDRYAELPDATFTRALAQTVCRALKIDPQPVLALLPAASPTTLDAVSEGLNTPFRERFATPDLSAMLPRAPLVWAALALLAAAALVYFWPTTPASTATVTGGSASTRAAPAAPAAPPTTPLPPATMPPRTEPSAATPAPAAAPTPAAEAASAAGVIDPLATRPATAPMTLTPVSVGAAIVVSEPVWLEVVDGSGAIVFQRTIQPGENLSFEQTPPLKLKIGNATAAKLSFRGEPVDLVPFTKGSVARLVLK